MICIKKNHETELPVLSMKNLVEASQETICIGDWEIFRDSNGNTVLVSFDQGELFTVNDKITSYLMLMCDFCGEFVQLYKDNQDYDLYCKDCLEEMLEENGEENRWRYKPVEILE